jgi:hypothetical protein
MLPAWADPDLIQWHDLGLFDPGIDQTKGLCLYPPAKSEILKFPFKGPYQRSTILFMGLTHALLPILLTCNL